MNSEQVEKSARLCAPFEIKANFEVLSKPGTPSVPATAVGVRSTEPHEGTEMGKFPTSASACIRFSLSRVANDSLQARIFQQSNVSKWPVAESRVRHVPYNLCESCGAAKGAR
jgi:hypothetical protein